MECLAKSVEQTSSLQLVVKEKGSRQNLMLRSTEKLNQLVFKGPVWSGLWVPEGVDQDRDWSTFVLELQKTGLDCRRPKTAVFCEI